MSTNTKSVRGFTLLEILLVVGIIAILAGIVILAINPTKQLGDTRNAQRRSDVLTILNAIYQFSIDHNGILPASTTLASNGEVDCLTAGMDAKDLDTELVTSSSTYLVSIPHDPSIDGSGYTSGTSDSGYNVVKLDSGRVTVCAVDAANDNNAEIHVTR